MAIRTCLEIGPYKKLFDPQQLDMEQHIAHYIQNNTTADEDTAKVLAQTILKTVLGEFCPDMFERFQRNIHLCSGCGGLTQTHAGDECPTCKGTGIEP